MLLVSIASQVYLIAWRPLADKRSQKIETFNETCIVMCFYFIQEFLDAALPLDARYLLGWMLVCVAVINVFGNLGIIGLESILASFNECVDNYHERKLRASIKKKLDNRRLVVAASGIFKDLEQDLAIREAADFCRDWFEHRKWLKNHNIPLKLFEEEKIY